LKLIRYLNPGGFYGVSFIRNSVDKFDINIHNVVWV
jgi:hypothetical protein